MYLDFFISMITPATGTYATPVIALKKSRITVLLKLKGFNFDKFRLIVR